MLKGKIKISTLMWIACFAVIAICVISIISLKIRINDLDEKKKELLSEKDSVSVRIDELKYEIARPLDDDYIIKLARERLGYHLPGEKVYIFDRDEND